MTTINPTKPALKIDKLLAYSIWLELRARANGVRESGAFLLTRASTPQAGSAAPAVRRAVYYDDLDPDCLTGGISLAGTAYDRLWRICNTDKLTVVADVHTHPETWVGQSSIDARNPMIALRGHLAFIIPRFAALKCTTEGTGLYRYEGNHEWTSVDADAAIQVTLLPDSPAETLTATADVVRKRLRHSRRGDT